MRYLRSALLLFPALLWTCFAQAQKPAPPNVLLVTIDTLRADHVGAYGCKGAGTKNLDALAAEGFRFEDAYAVAPITLPSHASIMTGAYPMLTGMHDFSGNKLSASQPTLAGTLKQAGYATGAVIGAAVLDSRFGLNSGFDFYYDNFEFNRLLETNLDSMERRGNAVVDHALEWLKSNGNERFFLWVHLYDPHAPYAPPEPYATKFKANPYDGEIAFADAQLGRVLDYLRDKKLYDGTLIVVSGDHGESLGEHGEKTHGFFIYHNDVHVPLIVKLPAAAKSKAHEVDAPVSLVDIMPTILEEAGVKVPSQVQGHSLAPLMEAAGGTGSDQYSESYLPRLHFDWSELRGIRKGQYHFIDAPKPELYDVDRDPGELVNLAEKKPAVMAEMRAALAGSIRANTADKELAEKTGLDAAMAERLKSLGYAAVPSSGDATITDRKLADPKERIVTYELISSAIDDSQHERIEDSIGKLTEALKAEKDSVPVHYLLGIDYYRKRDFADAAEQFKTVTKLSPEYALATYYLGMAEAQSGDYDAAITALKRTLDLDPSNFSAAFNLGAAYLRKQQPEDAIAAFKKAIELNPNYEAAHRALALTYHAEGMDAQAQEEMRKAEELRGRPQ